MARTFLITQSEVQGVLSAAEAVESVEEAFIAYGEGRAQLPPKGYLHFARGDLRCMPAYVDELGLAAVKNVNVHPDNAGLPAVMATVTVFDPDTGFPLAIMDGTYLTALRTGAAGAIAAKYLARSDSTVVGFVGAGRQAETQLLALLTTMRHAERILVCDIDGGRAQAFAERCATTHGIQALACPLRDVTQGCDILVTVTPVRKPLVSADLVRPGTHINAIGADAPGKQELESELVRSAKVIVDNWEQASHGGEINVPVSQGLLAREDIYADIGEIVTGRKRGRESDREVTIFDSTGLAVQDLACAAQVYRRLTADPKVARRLPSIEFLQ